MHTSRFVVRNGHVFEVNPAEGPSSPASRIGPQRATQASTVEMRAVAPHAGAPTVAFSEAFPSVAKLGLTMWAFGRRVERMPTVSVTNADGSEGAL